MSLGNLPPIVTNMPENVKEAWRRSWLYYTQENGVVQTWQWMREHHSPETPELIPIIAIYIAVVFIWGKRYKTGRDLAKVGPQATLLRRVMLGYNVLMSLFSLWTFLGVRSALEFPSAFMPAGLVSIAPTGGNCAPLRGTPLMETYMRIFYYSKFVEFLDTVFLILRAKRVSWLHYVHHIGVAICSSQGFYGKLSWIWIIISLNSFIHFLMYFYYACMISPTLRPFRNIINPFKWVLTTLQIAQFVSGLFWLSQYLVADKCFDDHPHIKGGAVNAWTYVNIVNAMFIHFFVKSYIFPTKSKKLAVRTRPSSDPAGDVTAVDEKNAPPSPTTG